MLTTLTAKDLKDLQDMSQDIEGLKSILKGLNSIVIEQGDMIDTIKDRAPTDDVNSPVLQGLLSQRATIEKAFYAVDHPSNNKPQTTQQPLGKNSLTKNEVNQKPVEELVKLEERLSKLQTKNLSTSKAKNEATAIKKEIENIRKQYVDYLDKIMAREDRLESQVNSTTQPQFEANVNKFHTEAEKLKKKMRRQKCGVAMLLIGIITGLIALPLLVCLTAGIIRPCCDKSFAGPFKAFFRWLITGDHHSKTHDQKTANNQDEEKKSLLGSTATTISNVTSNTNVSNNSKSSTASKDTTNHWNSGLFGNSSSSSSASKSSTNARINNMTISLSSTNQ